MVAGSFRSGSRTDAGVSALENVCAATLERPHVRGLVPALQARLPRGVWATGAALVEPPFNPRQAAWRQYRLLHPASGEGLGAMRRAAAAFVGTHDVSAFARVEAGRDPKRTVTSFAVTGTSGMWGFRVRGQSFLWNQVRRMVGAVLAVGRGDADVADVRASLASGQPHKRFGLAPAEGLLLERVAYTGLRWDAGVGRVADVAGAWSRPRRASPWRGTCAACVSASA